MGVQLQDIYSVSISSDTSYAYATPDCLVTPPVPGTNSGATGSVASAPASSPASPPVICNGVNQATPSSAQLVVTLIVAYKYA
jgi:hypothetical protein